MPYLTKKKRGLMKWPRRFVSQINVFQYHNLRGKGTTRNRNQNRDKYPDTVFAHNGKEEDEDDKGKDGAVHKTSAIWRYFEAGTRAYKTKHSLKECPRNLWSVNKGKICKAKGELVLCTVKEFEDAMCLTTLTWCKMDCMMTVNQRIN